MLTIATARRLQVKLALERGKRRGAIAYLFLSPWLIGLVFLVLGPMVFSLYLSFTSYNLLQPPHWVGIKNYQEIFTADTRFYTALKVTVVYVVISVPARLVVALLVAMLLNRDLKGISFFRAAYYLPSLLGPSVAISIMWQNLFGTDGLWNRILRIFDIHGRNWLGDSHYALLILALLTVWQFGSTMVVFLAGLRQIPEELYEASAIDGATKIRQFFHITLPMLSPVIFFNLIIAVIEGFMTFTQAYIITQGGPMDSTLLYSLYLYQQAFSFLHMGYACALAWILVVIMGVFALFLFATSKFWVFYESEGVKS